MLLAFAYGLGALGGTAAAGALSGLKLAALAVVAHAVWAMATTLAPDRLRGLVALAAAMAVLLIASNLTQMAVIALAAIAGALRPAAVAVTPAANDPVTQRGQPWVWLGLFAVLLVGLPLLVALTGDPTVTVFEKFYCTGSLVFGGGHVVLPLLEAELVRPGLIGSEAFIAGYGAAQAVPGPLFAFALLALLRWPPWLVVVLSASTGYLLAAL